LASRWRPYSEVVLGDGNRTVAQRFHCAWPVQPRRSNEAGDRASGDVLEQASALTDPGGRGGSIKPKELAFARGHEARPQTIAGAGVSDLVAVEESMEEDFESNFRPPPQARGEGRAGSDRRIAPMVRHHQHRDAIADVTAQQIGEPVRFALEAWRDVVDRRQQKAVSGGGHSAPIWATAALFASPLTNLHLRFRAFPGFSHP